MKENMIACEHYSDLYSSGEWSKSLNNSSDTWEALENAEKLLQEAKKKIIESTYDVPWLDLTLNRTSSSDLDESDLKIRQRVITKLQEVNKQKLCEKPILSSRNKNVYSSESLHDKNKISGRKTEVKKIYQSPVRVVETCRKCSDEKMGNKLKEKYKLKAFNQVNNCKVKTKTSSETINSNNSKTKSKTQLPVNSIKKTSIIANSCNNISKKNVKTVRASTVQNETCKQKKYDDILIDVAVQTSFKDQTTEEIVLLPKDIEQNQSEKPTDKHEPQIEILNSPKESKEKQEECQMAMDNDHEIKTPNNDISNVNRKSKGSFVKFLCQISQGLEDPVEIIPNSLENFIALQTNDIPENELWNEEFYDEWDAEEVHLNPPNLLNFDKILCNLDKNIEKMIKDSNKLEYLFIEAKDYNKLLDNTANKIKKREKINDQPFVLDVRSIDSHGQVNLTDKSPKNRINLQKNHEKESSDSSERNKTSDEMKFILEPRSRISSYESVSSEVFHQHARFSTPLNNYRDVEVTHHINKKNTDTNCNDNDKYFISEGKGNVDVNVDAKNEMKNDVNVFITRNQLSSISCEGNNSKLIDGKIIDNKKEKNYDLKSISVEKFDGKSHHSDFSRNNDTEEYKISSSSVKYSSSSSQTNSNHLSINNNNKTNNEIAEKHQQEQSEKLLVDDKMMKDSHLLSDSAKEKTNKENTQDEKNLEINEVEQKNKLTPASSKNDTHNRTSFDISGIYSENFEESVTETESNSKEHDIDKNFSSEKEIEEINKDNIENTTSTKNESEKILSNNIKTMKDLKINEMSESITFQVKIDKNPSTKSLKSLLVDNNEKLLEENRNDMEDKSSLSTSISRPSSQKSITNFILSQKKFKINKKGSSSSEEYSEGEIRLPDSYSLSIGEIKIPESQIEELNKNNEIIFREILHSSSGSHSPGEIRIPKSILKPLKKKNNSQTQSYGEELDTDIGSTSSFESPGEVR